VEGLDDDAAGKIPMASILDDWNMEFYGVEVTTSHVFTL
jgi:hypothetical protein